MSVGVSQTAAATGVNSKAIDWKLMAPFRLLQRPSNSEEVCSTCADGMNQAHWQEQTGRGARIAPLARTTLA